MHILVTRPEQQGEQTAAALRARGHRVLQAPVLRIERTADVELGDGPYTAVAMTSANAAYAVASYPQAQALHDVPVFAVGPRTGEAARAAGFRHIVVADGDLGSLIKVAGAALPARGHVLYLAGEDRAGDLAGALEAMGHSVRMTVVYRAVPADGLPEATLRALETGRLDAVLHYSRRTAATFLALAAAGSCLVNVLKCKHFCLSAQVAEPLVAAGVTDISIAARPSEAALLELVGNT